MKIFAKRGVDAQRADAVYRGLSMQGKERRLKVARKQTKQPQTTCPNCHYDLSGCFQSDDSLRPCPECGMFVSPGAVIMTWYLERKSRITHAQMMVYSGLLQALLAWVYIMIAEYQGGSQSVRHTFLIVWIVGVSLNVILLSYSACKAQSGANPNRHLMRAAVLLITCICAVLGSATLFFLIPVGIDFIVTRF